VRIALRKIEDAERQRVPVVVTDVRIPNEVQMLRHVGACLIWIDRPGVKPVNDHTSETGVGSEDADAVVVNDAGFFTLHQRIRQAAGI